jgi:hypothetical protein
MSNEETLAQLHLLIHWESRLLAAALRDPADLIEPDTLCQLLVVLSEVSAKIPQDLPGWRTFVAGEKRVAVMILKEVEARNPIWGADTIEQLASYMEATERVLCEWLDADQVACAEALPALVALWEQFAHEIEREESGGETVKEALLAFGEAVCASESQEGKARGEPSLVPQGREIALIGSVASGQKAKEGSQGRIYEHHRFRAGLVVRIDEAIRGMHPLSPLAGKTCFTCLGMLSDNLGNLSEPEMLVPVYWKGQILYVEEAFVQLTTETPDSPAPAMESIEAALFVRNTVADLHCKISEGPIVPIMVSLWCTNDPDGAKARQFAGILSSFYEAHVFGPIPDVDGVQPIYIVWFEEGQEKSLKEARRILPLPAELQVAVYPRTWAERDQWGI